MVPSATTEAKSIHVPIAFGKLPKGWAWARLDDLTEGVFDCPHSTPKLTESGPFVVRTQDIITGIFRSDQAGHVSEETYNERNTRVTPSYGDLLYSREGTYFGIAAEVPTNCRVCLGQRMVLIRPDRKKLDFRYLRNWLNSPVMAAHIHGYRDGSVAERLNLPTIRALPVLIPPVSTQRAIAHILGTLDDKMELDRRMNATLESMARALFQSWFVDFDPVRAKMDGRPPAGMNAETAALFPDSFVESELGLIPKGWRVAVLDKLTNFVIGGDWGKETPQDDCIEAVLCIRGADIPSLQAGGKGKMPVRFISTSSLAKRRLKVGDIVFEISGGSPTQSTGRPVLANEILLNRLQYPLTLSNFCRLIRPAADTSSIYLYMLLRHLYNSDEFLQYENGSTGIKNFAFTVFSSIHKLVKPDPALMRGFERIAIGLFDRIYQNGQESDSLANLRDTLLPKLLSGELSVKHAEKLVGEAI